MDTLTPPDNAISIKAFWTWMGPDGIARTKTKPKARIALAEAEENSRAVNSLYAGKKFPLLVDARNVLSMTHEARKHLAVKGRETNITGFAIMVKSPLSRVIGNFFMGLNKPEVPASLFDKEQEAVKWLKKYLKDAS
jgi:hypothetical protein